MIDVTATGMGETKDSLTFIEQYCSPKAFGKYRKFYLTAKRNEIPQADIDSANVKTLLEYEMYDQIVARCEKQYKIEKEFRELMFDIMSKITITVYVACS